MSAQETRFDLPGFSLPLNHEPEIDPFPNALDPQHVENDQFGRFDTQREIVMRQIINSIIDKPEWHHKVFDDEITTKWRQEVAVSGRDVSPKMMDWVIRELQWKAEHLDKTGMIMVYDTGVVISDTAISPELQQELRSAVSPLEMNPKKDYHPGSDEKVVDLVHPSLFPVIYGRSRILPDQLMGLDDCLNHVGEGQLLPSPSGNDWTQGGINLDCYSKKFQWMPCDIEFTKDGGCRIVSYINNLQPKRNRPLYQVIEKIIAQTIPLWGITLSNIDNDKHRISCSSIQYDEDEPQSPSSASESDWEEQLRIVQPEPEEFNPKVVVPEDEVNLREEFTEGLQIIVKLANIELTPEKPEYNGGSWHVEGALNEHICATAIYYYDSENITDSSLAFRQRAYREHFNEISYQQDRFEFLQTVFGFSEDVNGRGDCQVTQEIGGVSTKEGRLLTFPNILQHRVSPFALADASKPGHRKILAFFLVDPNQRIISSANVPPQSEDWWEEKRDIIFKALPRLPLELQDMVMRHVDVGHITMEEAFQYRLELMEERTSRSNINNELFETADFSLCEH
ncbi:hypothetical protein BDW59DRAFT_34953 [Aspergillus cavernicola]|uniref:Uncharacterized protein n=1 Tax=Aspergillus cavernicola TaxID=176166 RepID=A0ABR4HCN1_9EURO